MGARYTCCGGTPPEHTERCERRNRNDAAIAGFMIVVSFLLWVVAMINWFIKEL